MPKDKYIVCVDFDGVLHGYQSGWKGPGGIPDPPVPGALEWLLRMTDEDNFPLFEINVYSSRSKYEEGRN